MRMTEKCKPEKDGVYRRRSFEGLAPLTREIRNVTRPILGARGFSEVDILENWIDIVGSDLAQGVFPEKLTFERDNRTHGTLHVKSAGGAFAMLFDHQKERVIERINCYFGYPAVSRVKIRQGALKLPRESKVVLPSVLTPEEEQDLWRRVSSIEDAELRQKTFEVGAAMILKGRK